MSSCCGYVLGVLLVFAATSGCRKSSPKTPAVKVVEIIPKVKKSYPHTRSDFTQGLIWDGDGFIESTGMRGRSALLRKRLADGVELQRVALDAKYFGEGCARFGDRIYQLTWTSRKCIVYQADNFDPVDAFSYEGEGWGLTSDGTHLIMSNGSDTLQFRDPKDFKLIKKLRVTIEGHPLARLNELEWIDGKIYANVWEYTDIVSIDPKTGTVVERINCSDVFKRAKRLFPDINVLNGIAWDPDGKRMFITGKNWPILFHIELQEADAPAEE